MPLLNYKETPPTTMTITTTSRATEYDTKRKTLTKRNKCRPVRSLDILHDLCKCEAEAFGLNHPLVSKLLDGLSQDWYSPRTDTLRLSAGSCNTLQTRCSNVFVMICVYIRRKAGPSPGLLYQMLTFVYLSMYRIWRGKPTRNLRGEEPQNLASKKHDACHSSHIQKTTLLFHSVASR